LFQVAFYSILPNGRSARYYGTGQSRFNREPFLEDWAKLLQLLEIGQIKPIIHRRFPILQARQANEILESGQVIGNLVLVTPELI
jgi:NADPH:quinone reductase-like Zn-dependent oxidoreductase